MILIKITNYNGWMEGWMGDWMGECVGTVCINYNNELLINNYYLRQKQANIEVKSGRFDVIVTQFF